MGQQDKKERMRSAGNSLGALEKLLPAQDGPAPARPPGSARPDERRGAGGQGAPQGPPQPVERGPGSPASPPPSSGGSGVSGEIPLPQAVAERVKAGWRQAHPGLAFNKFIRWPSRWEISGAQKRDFLREFVSAFAQHQDKGLYKQFVDRRAAYLHALKKELGHCVERIQHKTQWRLVSGLGISHPFETGFVFDHTYGVPYLPGSSVKGGARCWARETRDSGDKRWGKDKDDDTVLDVVFGPEDSKGRLQKFEPARGSVIFFDAYPSSWPKLEVDILNPHYKDYYEKTAPPADWLSPNPVYFLTVASGQTFDFAVAVKPTVGEEAFKAARVIDLDDLAKKALEAVKGAATELGLGGKTAVGYGYFDELR